MAFMRYAKATVVQPQCAPANWDRVRTAARKHGGGNLAVNLVDQATGIFGSVFDPSKYLLTHATIVASVDVEQVPNVKLGGVVEEGFRVNRKYGDYRIRPACDPYINNNLDAWSRPVLLKSFMTFIGGQNFCEHVQIEALSKGRIIDAVARDIGDSVYIDILIATDRKHGELVEGIETGKTATLSMGCLTDLTICTQCGHCAADETELCAHVKYAKGNIFYDESGRKHRVAELCGHASIDPNGGVQFIEASWVSTPAFTGAVLRNVITPSDAVAAKAAAVLAAPPPEWTADKNLKAARVKSADFDMPEDDSGAGGDAPPAQAKKPSDLDALENDVTQHILERVKKRLKDQVGDGDKPSAKMNDPSSEMADNDSVLKEGACTDAQAATFSKALEMGLGPHVDQSGKTARIPTFDPKAVQRRLASERYAAGLDALVRTASSEVALMDAVATWNQTQGVQVPVPVYRAALTVGSRARYASLDQFLGACHLALGRQPTQAEAKTMVRLSQLLARLGSPADQGMVDIASQSVR